jgi:hypothetical protein
MVPVCSPCHVANPLRALAGNALSNEKVMVFLVWVVNQSARVHGESAAFPQRCWRLSGAPAQKHIYFKQSRQKKK